MLNHGKPLLVTLADKKYLEYAKQVFAGAYFNAGWQGDYLLLAHEIPEKDLTWFRKKGVLIKHCQAIYKEEIAETSPAIISKLYIFTSEFKKWSTIIYVDVDVIIRGSLDGLLNVKGYAAIDDARHAKIKREVLTIEETRNRDISLIKYKKKLKKLSKKYDINSNLFAAGFFVFNPMIIHGNSFKKLLEIIDQFHKIIREADMFAINIYFYHRWQKLPPVYDMYIYEDQNQWQIPSEKLQGIIIHFCGKDKPWFKTNKFYGEWHNNFLKADLINLENIPNGIRWSESKIKIYSEYLAIRELSLNFISKIYQLFYSSRDLYYKILCVFEKKSPRLFLFFKKIKKMFFNLR